MASLKTLKDRIPTKQQGIFYKEIEETTIDANGKIKKKKIDKVYIIRYTDNGKERLVTLGKYSEGIRETYCKTKRNEFITLAKNGELPPQIEKRIKKEKLLLDDVAGKYYDYKKKINRSSESSQKKYNNRVKDVIGFKDISEIKSIDVKKLQEKLLENNYSNKYINLILGELRSIFKYAIEYEYIQKTPMTAIKNLKVNNKRERYLSKKEVISLISSVEHDEQLHIFILLALTTGARIGAICKLSVKDIDFTNGRINMLDEKNAENYVCYLKDKTLIDLLKNRIKSVPPKKPILYRGDKDIKLAEFIRAKASVVFSELFNDVDTPTKDKVVVHTLRHTFASNLAINAVPILTIQQLMNHKDIKQTLRYAKLAPNSGEDAIQGLYNG